MAIESTPQEIWDSARLPQESSKYQAVARQAYTKDSSNLLSTKYSSPNDSSYLPAFTVGSEGESASLNSLDGSAKSQSNTADVVPTSALAINSQDATAPGQSSYSDGAFTQVGITVGGDANAAKGEQGLPIPNAQNGDIPVHVPGPDGSTDPGMVTKPTDSPPVDTQPAPNNGTGDTGTGDPLVANPDPASQINPDNPGSMPAFSPVPPEYTASIGGPGDADAVDGGGSIHEMEIDS
jgi:hypothetical protein